MCSFFFYRSLVVERVCEGEKGNQCGENFSLISNLNLKKTLPGIKPWEFLTGKSLAARHHFLTEGS